MARRPKRTPSKVSGYACQKEAQDTSHINNNSKAWALGLVLSDFGQVTSLLWVIMF